MLKKCDEQLEPVGLAFRLARRAPRRSNGRSAPKAHLTLPTRPQGLCSRSLAARTCGPGDAACTDSHFSSHGELLACFRSLQQVETKRGERREKKKGRLHKEKRLLQKNILHHRGCYVRDSVQNFFALIFLTWGIGESVNSTNENHVFVVQVKE